MSGGGTEDRWTFSAGPHGYTVRVEERRPGANVYLKSWDGDAGKHRKTSLGFPVRDADGELIEDAVERAEEAAAEASNALIRGNTPHERAAATVGEVCDLFRREEIRDMDGKHARGTRRAVELIENYLGRDFEIGKLGPREWNALRRDRASGRIDAYGHPVPDRDDRSERSTRTVQKTLKVLRQVCRFAARWRRPDGSFLLPDGDPTRGLSYRRRRTSVDRPARTNSSPGSSKPRRTSPAAPGGTGRTGRSGPASGSSSCWRPARAPGSAPS